LTHVVWWISAAVVVLALFVLVWAVLRLMGPLRELRRVQRKLLRRVDEAMELQAPVFALQERALAMQEQLEGIQTRVTERAARKAEAID
jgi:hypothetical protein